MEGDPDTDTLQLVTPKTALGGLALGQTFQAEAVGTILAVTLA